MLRLSPDRALEPIGFSFAMGHTLKKVRDMDSLDFDAIDSIDLASDPFFAPAAIVLLISALVFWIWNTDF